MDPEILHQIPIPIQHLRVFGHSWAHGMFHDHGNGEKNKYFYKNGNIKIKETTKIGSSTRFVLNNLEKEDKKYDGVVIFTGINDALRNPKEVINEFIAMVVKAKKSYNTKIYLFNLPDYPPAQKFVDEVNYGLKKLVDTYEDKVVLMDINSYMKNKKFAKDGLHPNKYGHIRKWFIDGYYNHNNLQEKIIDKENLTNKKLKLR